MPTTQLKKSSLPKAIFELLFEHQCWLESKGRSGKRIDQEEISFVNLDLEGVDFSHARLAYACFEGGNVRNASFIGAYLHSATFDGCDIEQANFSNANLKWATFNTNHKQACFDNSNLYKTAWTLEEGAENDGIYTLTLLTNTPGII